MSGRSWWSVKRKRERHYWRSIFAVCSCRAGVARLAGVDRRVVYYHLRKLNIDPSKIPHNPRAKAPLPFRAWMDRAERKYWTRRLVAAGNVTHAAKLAKINRAVLIRRLRKLGIDPHSLVRRKRPRGNLAWQELRA